MHTIFTMLYNVNNNNKIIYYNTCSGYELYQYYVVKELIHCATRVMHPKLCHPLKTLSTSVQILKISYPKKIKFFKLVIIILYDHSNIVKLIKIIK